MDSGRVISGALPVVLALVLLGQASPAFGAAGDIYSRHTVYRASTYGGHGSPSGGWSVPIDLNARSGSEDYGMPLYAPGTGRVRVYSRGGGWGNSVVWTSFYGRERLFMAHLSRIGKTGLVSGGDLIGRVGSTGHSDGPHLHIHRSVNGRRAALVLSGRRVVPGRTYGSVGPAPLKMCVSSVRPRSISPNGDRLADGVRVRFGLNETAKVGVVVRIGTVTLRRVAPRLMRRGLRSVAWDGKDSLGRYVASGLYRVVLTAAAGRSRAVLRAAVGVSFPPLTTLADSRARPLAGVLPAGDTLMVQVRGLRATTHYRLELHSPARALVGRARLQANSQGEIPMTALAYDVGVEPSTETTGTYCVVLQDDEANPISSYPLVVGEAGPTIRAVDAGGSQSNSFAATEDATPGAVWARGKGMSPGQSVRVYVATDRSEWTAGTTLADAGDGFETTTVGLDGGFLASVWTAPTAIGPYDLVADLDSDGIYDEGEPVDGHDGTGLTVQVPSSATDIITQIACDQQHVHRDVLSRTGDVFVGIQPPARSSSGNSLAGVFVVAHRGNWPAGTPLADVTPGGAELVPAQAGSASLSRVLAWSRPLNAGLYDVVIDVDCNGFYDPGKDFLDDIDSSGCRLGGFEVN